MLRIVTGLLVSAAASAAAGSALLPEHEARLAVDPDSPALLSNPTLRQRLAAGPHDYFRYVNGPFREVLCLRLGEALRAAPVVTLHGDPHLEQYAVTDRGRGLADFDDTTLGPAVLDLVRFATSLRLAAMERGWPGAEDAVRRFLDGYAAALRAPSPLPPQPRLVARLRAGFDRDRNNAMARAEALMETLPPEVAPSQEALTRTARMLAQVSGWPESFFKVKRVGALRIGIGSAADEKYLMRIEGDSRASGDDVILEVKAVRATPAGGCVRSEPGPDRILLGSTRLAYEPFEYAGGITLEGRSFWFHAWPDNYVELDVRRDRLSPAELEEIARDVGFQLGRGHPRAHDDPKRLRATLLKELSREQVAALSLVMAQATTEAWQRYKERLGT